ncbi:MAG: hypothetical protein NWT02_00910 [Opitutales bacterium]|jgi:hypothetical protein|nr:hypothetical protein [Opitutales bacterium]MDP4643999.1 hypothetical protein [Opitutales bacterium]MDP4777759.1 hypothetical protein [Opitutales bacterium]
MNVRHVFGLGLGLLVLSLTATAALPLGKGNDTAATGEWWTKDFKGANEWMNLMVPRDEVISFALYTTFDDTLKLTAQFYPLLPDEPRVARLEIEHDGKWVEVAQSEIHELGWSAHFRVEDWDQSKDVNYRVRHGEKANYAGLIRKDPIDKETITVASLSCNSKKDRGDRERIVRNIRLQDPDLLFFAGDQSYDHKEHTAAWLQFGRQFGALMRDRPTITIPDDHDVGQPNLWGEGGKVSTLKGASDGGYVLPAEYVRMVERCQTWHLPDAYDARPIQQGIGVYFTRLTVGEIDFAILEDRKFKSGPAGKIPKQGPRPDHIKNPKYDPKSIDVEGLVLLGERQLQFLREWSQDWTGTEMKAVLSQTPFAGAVTNHGNIKNRLHADMDSNGWPQTGRNKALIEIRKAIAPHLCGDQHLGVTFQHGIDAWNDGPWCHSSPAIVNTIYSRYWLPLNDAAGKNRNPTDVLPFTGEYFDGFENRITMRAYANPDKSNAQGSGYSMVYFNKTARSITFENWAANADVSKGDKPFAGWPITIQQWDNDGRDVVGNLGTITAVGADNPVVQVVSEDSGEVLYTLRVQGNQFTPRVYTAGSYTVNIGTDLPDVKSLKGLTIGGPAVIIQLK